MQNNHVFESLDQISRQLNIMTDACTLHDDFGDIPDPRLFTPQSAEEWEVVYFNLKMEVPKRFETIEDVTIWIRDNIHLNRDLVGLFLTEASNESVLSHLTKILTESLSTASLIDNLKIFFAISGIFGLDGSDASNLRVKQLLENFSKTFCKNNTTIVVQDWSVIADISNALLQISRSITDGSPMINQQDFFVEIRANKNSLPTRVIADIYHDFASNGPFRRICIDRGPAYLLHQILRNDWLEWSFGSDGERKTGWVVVTKSIFFIFLTENKIPLLCIPLKYVKVSFGRILKSTLELLPFSGRFIPKIKLDGVNTAQLSENSFSNVLTSIPSLCIYMPGSCRDDLNYWFDLLEKCTWECRQ